MKKYILLLAMTMMVFSLPVLAQAQDQAALLASLEAKAGGLARAGDYSDGLVIPYAVNDGSFSSGIAIYNSAPDINTFLIASFDTDGNVVASGSFVLLPGTNKVSMIDGLMDEGSDPSPAWGFTGIFATGQFIADRFVFQGAGAGFGELTMESQPY